MSRKRRGFSLLELTVVLVASGFVIGGGASLYSFVMSRTAAGGASGAALLQATQLADELTVRIRNSVGCDIVSMGGAGNALRVQLGSAGTDRDGDGLVDIVAPNSVAGDGTENYNAGTRLYYYWGDTAGLPSATGTVFWRGRAPNDSLFSIDTDPNWSLWKGSARWNLIESVTYSVDQAKEQVTITVVASSLNRAERKAGAASSSESARTTVTRTVFWRYER